MNTLLRVYYGDCLVDLDLTGKQSVTIGGKAKYDLQIPGMTGTVTMKKKRESWSFQSSTALSCGTKKAAVEKEEIYGAEDRSFAFVIYDTDYNDLTEVPLAGEQEMLLGRGKDCQIVIGSRRISRQHALLKKEADGWVLTDCSSQKETYINGKREKRKRLAPGDEIDLGLCRVIFTGKALTVRFHGDLQLRRKVQEKLYPYDELTGYPFEFRQSPRLKERVEEETAEIQMPQAPQNQVQTDLMSAIARPLVSVGMMAAMVVLFQLSPMSLIFSVPMTVVSIVFAITGNRSRKKKYSKGEAERVRQYEEYLNRLGAEVKQKQEKQRQLLLENNPDPEDCVNIAVQLKRRLWERRAEDADFLSLRLGKGNIPSCFTLKMPKTQYGMERDALCQKAEEVQKCSQENPDCPVVLDLLDSGSCGILGERRDICGLARSLVVQAAAHHSYEDLKIIAVCREDEWKEWEPIRWLPHVFDDTRTSRYLAVTKKEADMLLSGFQDELQQRFRELGEARQYGENKRKTKTPYLLFLCGDYELVNRHPIMKYLTENNPEAGVGALFFFDSFRQLPNGCETIVELTGRKGLIYQREDAGSQSSFQPDEISTGEFDRFARVLAPVRLDGEKNKQLPVSITFLEGMGVRYPKEIDLGARWADCRPDQSMAVPLGVRASGEPFYFDIHEKVHGPHGLVAGMTGSGKSEMVQSWILSMALRFPPEAVSFVLIDFKGTGLILPFKNLPHLAGTISDLDTNIGRNLVALENELSRRKALLDEYGVNNISAYIRLYQEGRAKEPLSYLFVIIDEFAEFKVQFPDFMKVVDRIFAIGRTLGVFTILLTQKPGGVVDDKMSANTRFRWCLKVASSADSRDMLGHTDAARLTNPGRAFVRVGEDEVYEQIQSYWSGAPYRPWKNGQKQEKLYVVGLDGKRQSFEAERTTGYRAEKNEIDAIVEYIDSFVREHEISRARNIWTRKLKDVIYLNQILAIAFDGERWNHEEEKLKVMLGMIDDPRSQSQYPLYLNFSDQGHTAVYGAPGTGKTTLLQTAVLSLALSYSSEAAWIYIMDFGGGNLRLFKNLPHVGDVAGIDEDEKLEKMMQQLEMELKRRKMAFSASGAMNTGAYRQMTGEMIPDILLVVDNAPQGFAAYQDLYDFIMNISREGGTYGIWLLVSAGSPSSIPYRISQNFRMNLALQLNDSSDYSAVVGRTGGLVPENLPGRGLMKGTPPLEFQTALPVEGETEMERFQNLNGLIRLMGLKWNGTVPASIEVMPERIALSDVAGEGIGLGLSFEGLQRMFLNLEEEPYLLVSAKGGDGGRHLLELALKQCMAYGPELCLIYGRKGEFTCDSTEIPVYLEEAAEYDNRLGELMPVLQKRQNQKKENPDIRFTPIVFVIPKLKKWFDDVTDETVRRMTAIVNLGADLDVVVLAAGEASQISQLYLAGALVREISGSGTCILTGGSVREHCSFQVSIPYSEGQKSIENQDGYWIRKDIFVKIRLVSEE